MSGQEFFDLGHDRVHIADEYEVVATGKYDEPGARDRAGEIPPILHVHVQVSVAMEDEGGNPDRGEDRSNVDVGVHPGQSDGG